MMEDQFGHYVLKRLLKNLKPDVRPCRLLHPSYRLPAFSLVFFSALASPTLFVLGAAGQGVRVDPAHAHCARAVRVCRHQPRYVMRPWSSCLGTEPGLCSQAPS